MECVRKLTKDLYWVGADDRRLELFENIHPIPRGVSYNAYVLLDEKTVLFDTADWSVCRQFLENVEAVLAGRPLDYLIVNHVEPDHAASLQEVLIRHPETKVISNEKAFDLMRQFGFSVDDRSGCRRRYPQIRKAHHCLCRRADGPLAGSHGLL